MSHAPALLGPSGLPYVDLGGERALKQVTKGDVTMSLQWIDLHASNPDYDEEGPVPCMALFHAHRRTLETSAYVIPQTAAFKFVRSDGQGPTAYFANAVALATLEMGFGPNDKSAQHRVIDLIRDHLPDLFAMSGEQPADLTVARALMGIEATVKVNGKVIKQEVF